MAADIQIAFQGGGAKFVAMLPVAEAFQESEKAGKINIKEVSGTSAGALCAALIAADCNFPALRRYLIDAGPGHVQNLMGSDYRQLKRLVDANWLEKFFAAFSSASALKSIFYRGNPVLHEVEFGNFLEKFCLCVSTVAIIEKLPNKKRLSIIATHLTKSEGITYQSGPIKQALRDSCALPIAFRSFAALSTNHTVDGGLCDNLPIESLISDVTTPIFAVFPEEEHNEGPKIDNIFSYMLSLFSASIENNVKRAKSNITEQFRIPIKTSYSTFGFLEATTQLADENWYRTIFEDTRDSITNFANSYGVLHSTAEIRFTDTTTKRDYAEALERLSRDYDTHAAYKLSKLIVKMNCSDRIVSRNNAQNRPAGTIQKVARIHITSERCRYFRSTAVTRGSLGSVWKAFNHSKGDIPIPIRVLALDIIINGQQGCLVEFIDAHKWLSKDDEVDVVSIHSERDALINLNMGKPDFLSVTNPHSYTIECAEVVLIYPKVLGRFEMFFDPKESSIDEDATEKFHPIPVWGDDLDIIGMRCKSLPSQRRFYTTIVPKT